MSENKIVIPCEVLKRITPLLRECINYDHVMFVNEFEYIEAMYYTGQVTEDPEKLEKGAPYFTEEDLNFILRKRSGVNIADFETQYDFILEVGNNLELQIDDLNTKSPIIHNFTVLQFDELWKCYDLKQDDYYYAFLMLIAVFAKFQNTFGLFDDDSYFDLYAVEYSCNIRAEQLRLCELFLTPSENEDETIKISYKGKTLTLPNRLKWFTQMLTDYLKTDNIEDIQKELQKDYPTNKKRGRAKNTGYDNVLLSACNLIHHTSLQTNKILNDREALFLIEFLQYLKLGTKNIDQVYIRALLAHHQTEKHTIQWWTAPPLKSPYSH